jgi:hypothetical protein
MGEPTLRLEECKGLNDMVELRDVTSHAVTVLQLLNLHRKEDMTMPMLVKEWRQNPKLAPEWYATIDWTETSAWWRCGPNFCLLSSFYSVRNNPPGRELTPSDCERVIVGLLVTKLINPICRYTAYEYVYPNDYSCSPSQTKDGLMLTFISNVVRWYIWQLLRWRRHSLLQLMPECDCHFRRRLSKLQARGKAQVEGL